MATMTLIEEREYPLLARKNVIVRAEFPQKPTPPLTELRKELATLLKVEENRIAVKHIKQEFGTNSAIVTAHVYKDEKTLKAVEEIKKRKKKEGEKKGGQEDQTKK